MISDVQSSATISAFHTRMSGCSVDDDISASVTSADDSQKWGFLRETTALVLTKGDEERSKICVLEAG